MSEEENKAIEYIKAQKGVYHKIVIGIIEKQQKEIEYYKAQDKNKGKLLNTALNETKNNCISKDKIREIIKLTQNREIVKLPNNETICASDCYELLNYLQELLEEN